MQFRWFNLFWLFKAELLLEEDLTKYHYLNQSDCFTLDTMDDAWEFEVMLRALTAIGFDEGERKAILKLVASILHFGNLEFTGKSYYYSQTCWVIVSLLLRA